MKKFLLFLILLIPIFNVNALTLCDNTELPNIPSQYENSDYIIFTFNSDTYLAILYDGYTPSINNEYLMINSPQIYSLTFNSWFDNGDSYVSLFTTILATTNNVTENNEVVYESGYNLTNCSPTPPTPSVPQDFSIINTIASAINTMLINLQQTFTLTQIVIGLL